MPPPNTKLLRALSIACYSEIKGSIQRGNHMNGYARIAVVFCLLTSLLTAQILIAANTSALTTQTSMTKSSQTVDTNTPRKGAKTIYKPSNTAIIFDVDGVILERTIPVPALLWRHKAEIAKAFFDFNLIKEIFTLVRMTAPVGYYISLFERKKPGLVPFARELVTTRTVNPKTICIVESLLAHGYKLHIGTNETDNEFALHQERFPIFSRFTTYTFADYSAFPDSIQKPQLRYFERMKERILASNKKITNFIFIDDRTDNVQASRDTGYFGIDFTTPEALEATLVTLGIMSPTCAPAALVPAVTL